MFCNKCGNRNPINSHFCRHCGARLDLPGASTPIAEEDYLIPGEAPSRVYDQAKVQKLLDLAFDLSERGDIVGAIMTCKEALVENPASVSGHSFLGSLYERQGEKEKAISQYELVLELNPDSTIDRENLQRLKNQMRRDGGGEKVTPARMSTAAPVYAPLWLSSRYLRAMPVMAAAMVSVLFILLINYAVSPPALSSEGGAGTPVAGAAANYVKEGREALAHGDVVSAEQKFRSALVLAPNDSDASYWLSRVEEQRNAGAHAEQTPAGTSLNTATPSSPAVNPPTASPPNPALTAQNPTGPADRPDSNTVTRTDSQRRAAANIPPPPLGDPSWIATPRRNSNTKVADQGEQGNDTRNPPFTPTENVNPPLPVRESRINYRINHEEPGESTSPVPASQDRDTGKTATSEASGESLGAGLSHERRGLQLQRQRKYSEAKSAFQTALQSFRQQKEAGVRVREADEGIKFCETAVRLCDSYLRQ
ncbi:MAG: tetratricopeptide repeat protein [Armatimonadetes bacterium]|nr:tetratricopeptide repeat protein [Armatimonadota bacterium]